MAFSLPCDGCRYALSGDVVTVRVVAFAPVPGSPAASRLAPSSRPNDYLLCPACAETLQAYIRYLQEHRGVPLAETG